MNKHTKENSELWKNMGRMNHIKILLKNITGKKKKSASIRNEGNVRGHPHSESPVPRLIKPPSSMALIDIGHGMSHCTGTLARYQPEIWSDEGIVSSGATMEMNGMSLSWPMALVSILELWVYVFIIHTFHIYLVDALNHSISVTFHLLWNDLFPVPATLPFH